MTGYPQLTGVKECRKRSPIAVCHPVERLVVRFASKHKIQRPQRRRRIPLRQAPTGRTHHSQRSVRCQLALQLGEVAQPTYDDGNRACASRSSRMRERHLTQVH